MEFVKSVEEMPFSESSMELKTTEEMPTSEDPTNLLAIGEVKSDITEKDQSQDGIDTDSSHAHAGDEIRDFVSTHERKNSSDEHCAVDPEQPEREVAEEDLGKVFSPRPSDHLKAKKRLIDTAAPFQSVKEAVSIFGETIDWKANRSMSLGRRKIAEPRLEITEESQQAEELENNRKLIEELKISLQKAQSEERQAKQESELARLRIEEMEQDIAKEVSIVAKAQLEVDEARHTAALSDLISMKEELESLRKEYASMLIERDTAVKQAEEAVAASKEVEKTVEDLTIELISMKESLESAQTSNLEAEGQRTRAVMAGDVKSKLDASSALLLDLKAELATYMQSKLEQQCHEERKKELEEVKLIIEKATAEVNCLKVASMSLKSKLEEERSAISTIRQREEMACEAVSSLKDELNRTRSKIAFVQMKEKEAREKMIDLPKKLQEAAQEADQAKSLVEAAHIELHKAKEEAEQAKARASAMESRLLAAQKEVEAVKASEKLAIAAAKSLQESESARSDNDVESPTGVTLTVEEYDQLSQQAEQANEQANMRVEAAKSQIDMAKESEMSSLMKLEELNLELAERRKTLQVATEKAEMAKEGKLSVEQELRKWRSDQEQQKKAGELDQGMINQNKGSKASSEGKKGSNKFDQPSKNTGTASSPEIKGKKKKKSIVPRVIMFLGLARRKTHPTK